MCTPHYVHTPFPPQKLLLWEETWSPKTKTEEPRLVRETPGSVGPPDGWERLLETRRGLGQLENQLVPALILPCQISSSGLFSILQRGVGGCREWVARPGVWGT